MKTNSELLGTYASLAPLALALERAMECRILSQLPFERPILDIGCGEGLFAKVLFAEKIDTGIDPDGRELQRARELDAYMELIECSGDAIAKPDGCYRTIFSNSVLEHIPHLEPVLREAYRLLAPGGRLYLTVPSDKFDEYSAISQSLALIGLTNLQTRYRAFYNRFWRHYHYYAPEQWAKIVQASGFQVIRLQTYAPKCVCMMNDLLVPCSVPSFLTKRLLNRWTLFPRIRRAAMVPIIAAANAVLNAAERCDAGGLVFLAAGKP